MEIKSSQKNAHTLRLPNYPCERYLRLRIFERINVARLAQECACHLRLQGFEMTVERASHMLAERTEGWRVRGALRDVSKSKTPPTGERNAPPVLQWVSPIHDGALNDSEYIEKYGFGPYLEVNGEGVKSKARKTRLQNALALWTEGRSREYLQAYLCCLDLSDKDISTRLREKGITVLSGKPVRPIDVTSVRELFFDHKGLTPGEVLITLHGTAKERLGAIGIEFGSDFLEFQLTGKPLEVPELRRHSLVRDLAYRKLEGMRRNPKLFDSTVLKNCYATMLSAMSAITDLETYQKATDGQDLTPLRAKQEKDFAHYEDILENTQISSDRHLLSVLQKYEVLDPVVLQGYLDQASKGNPLSDEARRALVHARDTHLNSLDQDKAHGKIVGASVQAPRPVVYPVETSDVPEMQDESKEVSPAPKWTVGPEEDTLSEDVEPKSLFTTLLYSQGRKA